MKALLYILSGVVVHMLYLDSIFIYEMKKADKCFVKYDEVDEKKATDCLLHLNSASQRYKGKYFGIDSALKYEKIVTKWKMQ